MSGITKQIALDFAHEVIGWQSATMNRGGDYCEQSGIRFWPKSTNQVLDHVLNWCNENDATFDIHHDGVSYEVTITINGPGHMSSDWRADSSNLGIALMEACLKAEREQAQERVVQP